MTCVLLLSVFSYNVLVCGSPPFPQDAHLTHEAAMCAALPTALLAPTRSATAAILDRAAGVTEEVGQQRAAGQEEASRVVGDVARLLGQAVTRDQAIAARVDKVNQENEQFVTEVKSCLKDLKETMEETVKENISEMEEVKKMANQEVENKIKEIDEVKTGLSETCKSEVKNDEEKTKAVVAAVEEVEGQAAASREEVGEGVRRLGVLPTTFLGEELQEYQPQVGTRLVYVGFSHSWIVGVGWVWYP